MTSNFATFLNIYISQKLTLYGVGGVNELVLCTRISEACIEGPQVSSHLQSKPAKKGTNIDIQPGTNQS
jgi:hypothetical protein